MHRAFAWLALAAHASALQYGPRIVSPGAPASAGDLSSLDVLSAWTVDLR